MTTALRLRHRLEYGLVAGIRGMLRHLPMKAVLAAGSGLGYVFYALDRGHRRLALANLNAAFPQRPLPERRAIAREMFAHFGRLLMVLLKFSTMARDEMLAHVEFEGDDRVRAAHTHGRGVLLFTGHFGYWEINALVHALALHPIAVVARPLDNPLLHDLLEHVRSMTGNSVIYRKGGLRRILRALTVFPLLVSSFVKSSIEATQKDVFTFQRKVFFRYVLEESIRRISFRRIVRDFAGRWLAQIFPREHTFRLFSGITLE